MSLCTFCNAPVVVPSVCRARGVPARIRDILVAFPTLFVYSCSSLCRMCPRFKSFHLAPAQSTCSLESCLASNFNFARRDSAFVNVIVQSAEYGALGRDTIAKEGTTGRDFHENM